MTVPRSRQRYARLVGLRPVTAAEGRALGFDQRKKRWYTSAPAGVQPTDTQLVRSRRQVDTAALTQSFERYARLNREAAQREYDRLIARGRSPRPVGESRYQYFRSLYLDRINMERSAEGLPPMTAGQLRTDPTFKAWYRDTKSKSKKPDGRLAKALQFIGLRDSTWTHNVGETDNLRTKGLL